MYCPCGKQITSKDISESEAISLSSYKCADCIEIWKDFNFNRKITGTKKPQTKNKNGRPFREIPLQLVTVYTRTERSKCAIARKLGINRNVFNYRMKHDSAFKIAYEKGLYQKRKTTQTDDKWNAVTEIVEWLILDADSISFETLEKIEKVLAEN